MPRSDVKNAPEPLIRRTDEAGKVPLDVLDVVQLRGERILDVNDEDLPVGLALIEESHDTEDLDLLDLTDVADLLADLADVQGVIIALRLGLGVHLSGILPSLHNDE